MQNDWICRTCEVTVRRGLASNRRQHLESAAHRHNRLIRRLLAHTTLSYAEIGRRVGLKIERIRQLNARMYPDAPGGHVRKSVSAADRRLHEWWERYKNHPAVVRLNELGFLIEAMPRYGIPGDLRGYYLNQAMVNGKVVAWRPLCEQFVDGRRYLGVWAPRDARVDFTIFNLRDELFYVFPAKRLRRMNKGTVFSDDPRGTGSSSSRHDYRDYREAWNLLPRQPARKKPRGA